MNGEREMMARANSQARLKKIRGQSIARASSFQIAPYRRVVQFGFLLITLFVGFKFILFVSQLERGIKPTVSRPPGVEAFLPISALISLKYWLLTGVLNSIHPASVVLLIIILSTALFLKKGFCSWVCPFGLLSEYLERINRFLWRRQIRLFRWADYPLRSLKFLLLGFFLWAIFVQMDVKELARFIYSPYNRVADIKMLKFFADMSTLTFLVLMALLLLSTLIPYFWCRYLCPYGALLGLLSLLSPFKIRRNTATCIDCRRCGQACPAGIKVETKKTVYSDECHACFRCVDACPVKDTLYFSVTAKKGKFPRLAYAIVLISFFLVGTTVARLTGHWHNSLSLPEYSYHIQHLNDWEYQHHRGRVPEYDPSRFSFPPAEDNDGNQKNKEAIQSRRFLGFDDFSRPENKACPWHRNR